ncbi:caspase-4-like [Chanos chanos]|uniref:Caspase-4-like n=1 Tax=Chanos chanos TaxID=29144 RepID=A0A6J2VSQ8_CHACN|nr:caspase-4-like [Chanos chanos]
MSVPEDDAEQYFVDTVPIYRNPVQLPCAHQLPPHYLRSWCQYQLEQKQSRFTCPRFDCVKKKTCGAAFCYQDVCQLGELTAKQQEKFEETLGALAAAALCDYKPCPGCHSNVERANPNNLCVHCTVCSAKRAKPFYFCWQCVREWKGPLYNASKCANNGCQQTKPESSGRGPLVLCTPEFKTVILKKEWDDIYNHLSLKECPSRKRMALVINNIHFEYVDDRTGAEKDEQSINTLLKDLGYNIVLLRDLTAEGMDVAISDFSKREEHFQSDSCFVVIMSHGKPMGICGVSHTYMYGQEKDVFPVDKIFNHLNTPNCPGLRDKPKIILIQSCRGNEDGSVSVQDSAPGPSLRTEHREKDFCCMRSCTPDTVSYRTEERGSDFIQDVVEIFNHHAHENDIEELFRKVLKKFKETHPNQMPCKERTTLSKKFYLFPGL